MKGIRCGGCGELFSADTFTYHRCYGNKEQPKMTREEAKEKTKHILSSSYAIETLEALGLLKFDESKNYKIFELNNDSQINQKLGVIRLEEWPEGLVLWVGGEIKWKSWEQPIRIGDEVIISDNMWIGEGILQGKKGAG